MILAILDHLAPRREEFLADLARLVHIDSPTTSKRGVDAVGRVVAELMERAGLAVSVLPVTEYGDCVLGRLAGPGSARIFLIGHLDTVFAEGTAAARPMQIQGDRILGPGTSDMKAGLLAGVYALAALRATAFDGFGELLFFCNSDEEVGSPASFGLYRDLAAGADAALVLESARHDGSIVTARKGGAHYRLTVHGRAAHAGVEPDKGANAIQELARLILDLQALNGFRPAATVNVCTVRGGSRSNVIPDWAEAEVDVRIAAAEDAAALRQAILEALERPGVPGTRSELDGGPGIPPMPRTAATDLLFELARQVASELGIDLRGATTGGISDGNRIASLGTPVLDGLGPVGGLDHSPDEYVELESIVPRTALLAGLIRAIAEKCEPLRRLRSPSA